MRTIVTFGILALLAAPAFAAGNDSDAAINSGFGAVFAHESAGALEDSGTDDAAMAAAAAELSDIAPAAGNPAGNDDGTVLDDDAVTAAQKAAEDPRNPGAAEIGDELVGP
jgi:hypothetical protein